MQRRRNDFDSPETRRRQVVRHPSRSSFHVGLVFGFGADARNTEKVLQFGEVLVAATINKFSQSHRGRKKSTSPFQDNYELGRKMLRERYEQANPRPRQFIARFLL